jgi:3-oxoacyl-[acyl-carrier protein] reductase
MDLKGKVALVTGGSRGIGRAICVRLARAGAAVAVNYRQETDAAETVVGEVTAAGSEALAVQADVVDAQQVAAMVARIEARLGPIDILVNNAGVIRRGDLCDFDFTQMDGMRRVNVDGVVHCTRAVVDGMKDRKFGRIINLTSIAGHGTSMAATTFYAATKAAVSMLTRRFAMELGPYGITVNAVAPGFIMTDMAQGGVSPEQLKELIERISAKAMLRRVGQADEIAAAVGFLASPDAAFMTAQILTVDGGRMDYIGHA